MTNLNSILKSRGITLPTNVHLVNVWMWELDYKESWALKNWHFWTMVLEKTLEIPLDGKEIKPVNHKGDQFWIFIGRTDAETETPILWPPNAKNWLIWKDPDAGKDWRQEKGMTEYEMVGWNHWLFVTPWTAARQASLSITNSQSLLKLMSKESVMPSTLLILCHSLLLPSIFCSIRVFSNELVLCIRWPKYWSYSFSSSPSNEYLGLISFRID